LSTPKEYELNVKLNLSDADILTGKLTRLVELLKEAKTLTDELASNDLSIKYTLETSV